MQFKKIVPLALALTISTTAAAGAANLDMSKFYNPTIFASQSQRQLLQRLCDRFDISFCGQQVNCPVVKPDNKPEQTPDGDTGSSQGSFASQVVALVNAERAKEGLSPLTIDARVQQAAQVRAQESAQSFSHTRPNGSSFSTALTEAGVSYRGAGENIAYGQSTPQAVVTAWMNSSGHRANIMSKNFTTIGVGYSVVGGTPYWAQLFTY
ncbi:CAP domain-containing protein [Clostridia bacterium UC5.1-1D1]|uniref:CAP domain-containing protein n=1 Tax=Agathobaculum massiliense TaxID=3014267 RepID=UPI0006C7A197